MKVGFEGRWSYCSSSLGEIMSGKDGWECEGWETGSVHSVGVKGPGGCEGGRRTEHKYHEGDSPCTNRRGWGIGQI